MLKCPRLSHYHVGRLLSAKKCCSSASGVRSVELDPVSRGEKMFKKVLIANRGEIACRIIRTAKAMGIKTVAVHSDIDQKLLHVKLADEAICIGRASTSESYLLVDRILDAAQKTGSDCVHPGYGFLSENTGFAKALTDAGITFIGPNSKAILDMGDKINSKRIATDARVNMIPGYDGEIETAEDCVKVAGEIGYPVMIKASAGGGGKGMRVAWSDAEARDSFRLAKQEALASFGDDRILVEKFIDNPRHIEIQVLCDRHGNALWLNERECSIQRRNQKLIEEAPSTFVNASMRQRMGEQAVQLARAVGYDSAGTVEFLVDSARNFYFLEMNTRLQVEHPITEQITGIDLVQQMFRVAYGHSLNLRQSDVGINGWAFECRVYAEDSYKDFGLPSIGRLTKYVEPTSTNANDGIVRCDSGIEEGSEISIYYDPLICKLITHGKDRKEAQRLMQGALEKYVIRGLTHNIPLLSDIFSRDCFTNGKISTNYLTKTYPDGFQGTVLNGKEATQLVAASAVLNAIRWNRSVATDDDRKNHFSFITLFNGEKFTITLNIDCETSSEQFEATLDINDEKIVAKIGDAVNLSKSHFSLELNGETVYVQLLKNTPVQHTLIYKGSPFALKSYTPEAFDCLKHIKEKPKMDAAKVVMAPMPGTVRFVGVVVGDMVSEGQELCVIEAMKMQNSLHAAKTGKVKAVNCKVGENVDEDSLLIELE